MQGNRPDFSMTQKVLPDSNNFLRTIKSVNGVGPVVKGGCPAIIQKKWQLRR